VKPPFGELFFEGVYGKPFEPDEAVDEELRREKMVQHPAPFPWREAELRYLMKGLGLEDRITAFPIPGTQPAPTEDGRG